MPKIKFDYSIKGSFELEVPSDKVREGSLEKSVLKKYRDELKKDLEYELNGPLVRQPKSGNFKGEFKITRLTVKVEDEQ